MADIISVTDYWSVARGVLMVRMLRCPVLSFFSEVVLIRFSMSLCISPQELLAEVPWADHVSLWRLLTNLKRICCSTAYLHAFSQEVLRTLEEDLLEKATASDETAAMEERAEKGGYAADILYLFVIA